MTTDGSPIIEARGVTKTYDTGTVQVRALKNVGLTIRRGEMVSITDRGAACHIRRRSRL